ncbi:NON-SPECIFIC LIPID-TRANSFER PROTEIN 1-RELATED [Salix purpurea]|uniref:Non-specific lipid-transfer protein n=1 Tax=Salix purpurea TaxID=77065 RepID=A0A9Q0WFD1_SALPP|nr:NON-SPECIFIC LIPID-TRANSFER PROTEIN 1-RELATED [Salix purpurea]
MANAKLISTLLLCMVVKAPMLNNIEASVQCHTVTVALATCLGYLTRGGRSVPSSCCKGVINVKNAARTTKDRRETCVCLKRAAGQYRVNYKFAAALPAVCKVHIPYRISRSINCYSIK